MAINVTFDVPKHIAQGIATGKYERMGGVVREMGSKQVVMWLKEGLETSNQTLSNILAPSTLNATASTALAITTPVTSILNLAVSTMSFIVIKKRLGVIEQQLEQAQEILQTTDYKIDLSFYANFRAALDLAYNAFTMTHSENRKMSAMQAINRFFEAEQHYTSLADIEINNGSLIADEYLSTLCLAYATEVRCYLELEELDTAQRRMQEGVAVLQPRIEKHINTLLTSNPAAYLHPSLKEHIGLKQLTKIYQWLDPNLDESDVFEMHRENLFNLAQKPKEWMNSLPQAIRTPKNVTMLDKLAKQSKKITGVIPSISKNSEAETASKESIPQSPELGIYGHLPKTMELMESMIEEQNRFTMYESELEMIHQSGMSFHEWQQLEPPITAEKNKPELVYITVS